MKRFICLFISAVMLISFSACGNETTSKVGGSQSKTVSDVLNGEATASANTASAESSKKSEASDNTAVDVDLTALNSTMVYSEVYNMMTSPDDYKGKTVRMSGSFAIYQTDSKNYYACIIADATACCSQGLEFVWKGTHKYPNDYPELGTEITVTGTFGTYYEGTSRYCQLEDAEVVF